MKAVVLTKSIKAEEIEISNIRKPKVKKDWVLIKVKAFGLNNSEKILRQIEINNDYIKKPIVPGIECVGIIENASNSNFKVGDKVFAIMGGMGRSFNGSYAEYCLVPTKNVFKINSKMSFAELGAIPETFFTAFGSLFECLNLQKSDTLLIRGGTCALGYASLQIAHALGTKVIATADKQEKLEFLKECGADVVFVDNGTIRDDMLKIAPYGVEKILELVGCKTVVESMRWLKDGGICCNTGCLGKQYALYDFDPIKDIPNGRYLTGFFSNYPTQEKIDEILKFLDKHKLSPKIGKIFAFDDVKQAVIAQDKGLVNGKIVVVVENE
jgi:NADPH:quinone reductase-like Zn-dependent oxidoreductase